MGTEYDDSFFDTIRAGCQSSAAVVAPLVREHYVGCRRVVDVGCGEGWWGRAFQDLGCDVLGVDGEYVSSPAIPFLPCDIAESRLPPTGARDLAVCLEVAEHLPPDRAETFVWELCSLAPVVLFSAAIPGQGGTGHLNEQWPQYWVDLFRENDFKCSGALRWKIWNDDRVENWYRQNLIVATSDCSHVPALFADSMADVLPVVHPILYDARRA